MLTGMLTKWQAAADGAYAVSNIAACTIWVRQTNAAAPFEDIRMAQVSKLLDKSNALESLDTAEIDISKL
jgi:hypothetical protein